MEIISHYRNKETAPQSNIRKVSGMCPELIVKNHPNHAYVGALIAKKYYPRMLPFLAYPIMGHHTGLYDYPDYESKLRLPIPSDVDASPCGIDLKLPHFSSTPKSYDFNHVIRMLFSCLVDADFLDTLCLKNSASSPGFYSLTVPTGGGKTLSSLVWAMNHAIRYGKKRIIIAIPYTSIIVQTAQVLRGIFGSENVLEHHSNVSFEKCSDHDGEVAESMKLATENWDYPIIVTTNVQLFESMYSSKPSHCRKLHNICHAVLILDEIQTLPTSFLQPILNALKTYQRLFGLSVLFTTASQPELGDY